MKSVCRGVLPFCLALIVPCSLTSQQDYAAPVMAGISNHGRNAGEPYASAGDRSYLIGTQDGGWEDMSIEDLPVGGNLISFSRGRTGQGKNQVLVIPGISP